MAYFICSTVPMCDHAPVARARFLRASPANVPPAKHIDHADCRRAVLLDTVWRALARIAQGLRRCEQRLSSPLLFRSVITPKERTNGRRRYRIVLNCERNNR